MENTTTLDDASADSIPDDSVQANDVLTYQSIQRRLHALAESRGEWAGCPILIPTLRLTIEPRSPFACLNNMCVDCEGTDTISGNDKSEETKDESIQHINSWYCADRNATIIIYREEDGKHRHYIDYHTYDRIGYQIRTIGAAIHAWNVKAEAVAQQKLQRYITAHAFTCYQLTGSFLESSPRSNVTYLFRKSRPTVAISKHVHTDEVRVLTTLCLHPIGYYNDTWAGVLVPTDDVIAHLLFMRGDEAQYWKRATHHPPYTVEAGL